MWLICIFTNLVVSYFFRTVRQLIKPILAGLLECNISKAMKFEDFFSKVDYIVNLKPLRLFKPKDASEIILYVAKTDRYVFMIHLPFSDQWNFP